MQRNEQMPRELAEDLRERAVRGRNVPVPGRARDMQNPGEGEQTPDEQRHEGQKADMPAPRPEEVEDEDITEERPGTTGAQPGLPA